MESSLEKKQLTVRDSLVAAGLYCFVLLLIYYETAWSMVSIWLRSDTFAHGFLIVPIALWLIWTRRDLLAPVQPAPAVWLALLLVPFSLAWLLAWLVDVSVIQQLALVGMIVSGVWAIAGYQVARVLAFPLFFLFFAVPMGEGLIAPMMEFTAYSTVWMIEMTGIPVYREGLNFALPSGRWSVVEACSGVRYIIASVTVGTLYAYLTYRSLSRRVIFILISAFVPVIANTVRAYIIVMLGHLSDMTIATGADHLVYGWVFFGLVIFVLFWLGSFFREDLNASPTQSRPGEALHPSAAVGTRQMLLLTLCCTLLLVSVAPIVAHQTLTSKLSQGKVSVVMPDSQGDWEQKEAARWDWRPASKVSGQQLGFYELAGDPLVVYVQYAGNTAGDEDVVGSSTLFAKEEDQAIVVGQKNESIVVLGHSIDVDGAQIRTSGQELLVWSWYVVGDVSTSNNYLAKLKQVAVKLGLTEEVAYRIILATPYLASSSDSRVRLQRFLDEHAFLLYEKLHQPGVILP